MNKKILFYGFMIWLIPFITAFILYPIHESNRPLFESIMPVTITLVTVSFSLRYFREVKRHTLHEGLKLGIIWLTLSILLDLLLFIWGPMKMSIKDYIADIGLTYLIIPTVTAAIGHSKASN